MADKNIIKNKKRKNKRKRNKKNVGINGLKDK